MKKIPYSHSITAHVFSKCCFFFIPVLLTLDIVRSMIVSSDLNVCAQKIFKYISYMLIFCEIITKNLGAYLFECSMSHDYVRVIKRKKNSVRIRSLFTKKKHNIYCIFLSLSRIFYVCNDFDEKRGGTSSNMQFFLFNCHRICCHHSFLSALFLKWFMSLHYHFCNVRNINSMAEKGIASISNRLQRAHLLPNYERMHPMDKLSILHITFARIFIDILFSIEFNWLLSFKNVCVNHKQNRL